jgi:site-specific DNA-cytosine methylase
MKRGVDIECFSCSGGMAEGFRRAGVTFDFVFDKDPNAVASYTKNLGHAPIQMDVRDLMRMVRGGWSPGPVRLFVADPPCTPWSRAGKRKGLADERDMLRETADLIIALRPQFYVIGNVPGLQDSTSWGVVQDVIGGLAAHGYCVADYVSLDAADYGVPQHRVRPFWFGHLGGDCIRWPAPTHGAPAAHPSLPGLAPLEPWVTCRQALQHLPLEALGRPVRMKVRPPKGKDGGDAARCSRPDDTARTVVASDNRKGGQILLGPSDGRGTEIRHPASDVDAPSHSIKTNTYRIGSGGAVVAGRHRSNRPDEPSQTQVAKVCQIGAQILEWPWDRPSTVVYADDRITPPGHHDGSMLTGPNAIVLSEKAASILQGFPEGWLFAGETKKARWSQLGQAMPPPLAHAVALAVVDAMDRVQKIEAA